MTLSISIVRLRNAIMLVLTAAAVAASSAQASRPAPDAVDRYLANHQSHMLAPDDRPGMRRGSESAIPDAIDRYLANRPVPSTIEESSGEGFAWRDAGIGAAGLSLVSVLTASGLLLMRRRQHA